MGEEPGYNRVTAHPGTPDPARPGQTRPKHGPGQVLIFEGNGHTVHGHGRGAAGAVRAEARAGGGPDGGAGGARAPAVPWGGRQDSFHGPAGVEHVDEAHLWVRERPRGRGGWVRERPRGGV